MGEVIAERWSGSEEVLKRSLFPVSSRGGLLARANGKKKMDGAGGGDPGRRSRNRSLLRKAYGGRACPGWYVASLQDIDRAGAAGMRN